MAVNPKAAAVNREVHSSNTVCGATRFRVRTAVGLVDAGLVNFVGKWPRPEVWPLSGEPRERLIGQDRSRDEAVSHTLLNGRTLG